MTDTWNRYTKKPKTIRAIQWDGSLGQAKKICQQDDRLTLVMGIRNRGAGPKHSPSIEVQTDEGTMTLLPGNWLIEGLEGEVYPCRDSVFRASYEAEDE